MSVIGHSGLSTYTSTTTSNTLDDSLSTFSFVTKVVTVAIGDLDMNHLMDNISV